MSIKTRLTSLITTFVLLCSLLTVGVFAVKNTTFNVGGDIVFNVQGIEADIELTTNGVQNAKFNNDEEIGKDVLSKIQIRNTSTQSQIESMFSTWSNLDMTFAEGQSTATIELKITNKATEEDNYIDITALADATTKDNAKINVRNNAGGITALLTPGDTATYTITFKVTNNEYKAELKNFAINFDMQKKAKADFPRTTDTDLASKFAFVKNSDGSSMSIKAAGADNMNYGLTGDVVIPSYVNDEGVIYPITAIAEYGFGHPGPQIGCGFTSLTIPNTVILIRADSLVCCKNLETLVIGQGVETIGRDFLYKCASVNLSIPSNVTSISDVCCRSNDITIDVNENNMVYDSRDNCNAIMETATDTLIKGSAKTKIPPTTKVIASDAFGGSSGLTSITIPDSVEAIRDYAFNHCDSLTSITIGNGVTSIENGVLYRCDSLTTVNYRGTQEQWNTLLENVGYDNDCLLNATLVPNYTGE